MKCPIFSEPLLVFIILKFSSSVVISPYCFSRRVTQPAALQLVLQGAGRVHSVQQILLELNLIHDISK